MPVMAKIFGLTARIEDIVRKTVSPTIISVCGSVPSSMDTVSFLLSHQGAYCSGMADLLLTQARNVSVL